MPKIKTTFEFYDKNGLMLHSGDYAPIEIPELGRELEDIHKKGQAALDVMGSRYPRAKTVTLRCDIEGKMFPITLECVNRHFDPEQEPEVFIQVPKKSLLAVVRKLDLNAGVDGVTFARAFDDLRLAFTPKEIAEGIQ